MPLNSARIHNKNYVVKKYLDVHGIYTNTLLPWDNKTIPCKTQVNSIKAIAVIKL